MNKELIIHLVIGAAAVGTLYWLYTRIQAPPAAQTDGFAIQTSTDMSTGQPGTPSSWWDIFDPGIID